MGLLRDGDIYIKVEPDTIGPESEEIKKIDDDLLDLLFVEGQVGVTKETTARRQKLEKLKKYYLEEEKNYAGTDEFFILKIKEEGIYLTSFTKYGKKHVIKCDPRIFNEKYKSLMDFLAEAEYVGKEFVRKKPIYKDGIKLTDYIEPEVGIDVKILYKTSYAMLIKYKTQHRTYFEMLKPFYFLDNNYDLIGNTDKTYSDKKEMYKTVADEIEIGYSLYKKYNPKK